MKSVQFVSLVLATSIALCAANPGEIKSNSVLTANLANQEPHFYCPSGECTFKYSDATGPNGSCEEPRIPRIPGNSNPTLEEFCGYHQTIPASQWDLPYHSSYPLSTSVPNGEMIGCIIGNNLFSAEARLLPGWQGKGYNATTGVFTNLVRMDGIGFEDTTSYPGRFYVDADPEAGFSWKLDYGVQTNIPIIGPLVDTMIDRLLPGRYLRNMGGFEDHYRELAPGIWMGKVYALPYMLSWDLAFGNLTPFKVNVGVPFILFQSCAHTN